MTYADELHHAVNDQYRRIVNYFRPQFLLGLIATPERMDGRNIYEICDYNVPYEISLKEAINKGMLVLFHYYTMVFMMRQIIPACIWCGGGMMSRI